MRMNEVISALAELRNDAALIVGPGMNSGALYQCERRLATIYDMELGYPTAMCLGLALAALSTRVIAVEGDGSMLAGIGALSTAARYAPENLIVVVLNNGVYGTTGSGQTRTAAGECLDFPTVARGAGFDDDRVLEPADIAAFRSAVTNSMQSKGPWLIEVKMDEITGGTKAQYAVPEQDLVECAIAFRREMINRGLE